MAPQPGPSLKAIVKAGASEAMALLVAGVLTGGIAGFWALAAGDGVEDSANVAARPYLALVLLLPAVLVLMNFSPPNIVWFDRRRDAVLLGAVAGGAGGLLGALGYFVPASNIPSFLGGEDAADMYEALRAEVGLSRFLIVVGVTFAAGLAAGTATHYRVAAFRRLQNRGA